MLLAIDVGNTNIKMALYKGNKLVLATRLITNKNGSASEYKRIIRKKFGLKLNGQIEAIIVCSVVPSLATVLEKTLFTLFGKKALFLGREVIAPIKNCYKKPQQVGQDRLANAVAAFKYYGGPVIIVDFGTAVTFDIVSAQGSYLGGVIFPGVELALEALVTHADLLPRINLNRPKTLIGRDTVSSIKSGMIFGYGFLVEGILQGLKKKIRPKSQVIATGGIAGLISSYCRSINVVNESLTLEGLRISYQASNNKQN